MKLSSPLVQRALTVLVGLIVIGVAVMLPESVCASIGVPSGKSLLGAGGFGLVMLAIKHWTDWGTVVVPAPAAAPEPPAPPPAA